LGKFEKIFELAHFDKGIHLIQSDLEQVPEDLSDLENELNQIKGPIDQWQARLDEINLYTQNKQVALDESQALIKSKEEKLYMIKTNKEYQAVLAELAETKRVNKEIEEEILQLMAEAETLQGQVNEQKPILESKVQKFAEEKSLLESRAKALKDQLQEELQKRNAFLEGIAADLLESYEAARRQNPDSIATIDRGACQSCYMRVPPQLVIEVQRMENLHSCPNCQRLLFVAVEEDETAKTDGS
jgi:uncharacterized protein